MKPDGQLPANYKSLIPEAVHVYVLPALMDAADVLNKPEYKQAALRALHYYNTISCVFLLFFKILY